MYIGIDIGGTNVAVGLVENGEIVEKTSVKTKDGSIIEDIAAAINRLLDNNGRHAADIKSIGIGAPGTPDKKRGVVSNIFNVSSAEINFREELKKHFNAEVYIENDARCAALGELTAGAARGKKDVVMLTLGTGVGCGIIIGGKIYSGFNNAAGEFGHTTLVPDGEECKCGARGCYEQYASVTGLIKIAQKKIEENSESKLAERIEEGAELDGKFIFDEAHQGDVTALSILEEYRKYVAIGIVNIINIFEPEMVVVGGGISAQGEYLIKPIRKYVRENAFVKNAPIADIVPAKLGNDAGIIGAAMLGFGV